jgi:hypothetical protein
MIAMITIRLTEHRLKAITHEVEIRRERGRGQPDGFT